MVRYQYSNVSYSVKVSPLEALSTGGSSNNWLDKEVERAVRTFVD